METLEKALVVSNSGTDSKPRRMKEKPSLSQKISQLWQAVVRKKNSMFHQPRRGVEKPPLSQRMRTLGRDVITLLPVAASPILFALSAAVLYLANKNLSNILLILAGLSGFVAAYFSDRTWERFKDSRLKSLGNICLSVAALWGVFAILLGILFMIKTIIIAGRFPFGGLVCSVLGVAALEKVTFPLAIRMSQTMEEIKETTKDVSGENVLEALKFCAFVIRLWTTKCVSRFTTWILRVLRKA